MSHEQLSAVDEIVPPSIDLPEQYEDENKPKDECGVYGVYAPGESVTRLTYDALHALQHRGQNGAGVAVYNEATGGITIQRGLGLVDAAIPEVIPRPDGQSPLDLMYPSPVAIGHTRYSTAGDARAAQPLFGEITGKLALAQNGHVEGIDLVARMFGVDPTGAVSDSAVLTRVLDQRTYELGGDLDKALDEVLPELDGAYCLTITDGQRLIAVRDPWGFHPLSLGKLADDKGYAVASESVAFEGDVQFVRDIEQGEILTIDENGLSSRQINRVEPTRNCMFEYIYTARPDSIVNGRRVYTARKNMGRRLAEDYPANADVVVGVPQSGLAAAAGFAQQSGLPLVEGIFKNSYTIRSFIMEGQDRDTILRRKLRPNVAELEGQRIVLVDDSLIKGNTMKALIGMLREAGVLEVHVRLAAPRYEFSCYMGMATGDASKLVASQSSDAEICDLIKADSIGFNSVESIERAVNAARETSALALPVGSLCTACATGKYPFKSGIFKDMQPKDPVSLGMPAVLLASRA